MLAKVSKNGRSLGSRGLDALEIDRSRLAHRLGPFERSARSYARSQVIIGAVNGFADELLMI